MITIAERGVEFGRRSDTSARSVLVSIFGDSVVPTGGEIWLGDLISLAAPFGFSDRLVRTSMYRLSAEGWFDSERVGRRSRYRLTSQAREDFSDAEARIYHGRRPEWNGEWTMVFPRLASIENHERDALGERLGWQGFVRLAPEVYGLPSDGREQVCHLLDRLDISTPVPTATARFDDIVALAQNDDLGVAFGLDVSARRYRLFLDHFDWTAFLPEMSDRDAYIVRTMVVHELRRASLIDPWLPEGLLPANWVGDEAYQLAARVYDEVSPAAWAWLNHVTGMTPDHCTVADRFRVAVQRL